MQNQRNHFRFPVQRRAFITRDGKTTLCEVHDLTDGGLQFHAELALRIGDTVRMEVQLDGECIIHVELLVIHADSPCYGGRMTQISPDDHRQLALYIERLIRAGMQGPAESR